MVQMMGYEHEKAFLCLMFWKDLRRQVRANTGIELGVGEKDKITHDSEKA